MVSPISSRTHCSIQADTQRLQISSEEGKEIQVQGTKFKITILTVTVSMKKPEMMEEMPLHLSSFERNVFFRKRQH